MSDNYIRMSDLQPSFQKLNERLDHIEQYLVAMGAAAGYAYAPFNSGMPPEVKALARAGKTLEALKLYREMTGASFEQAKAAVTVL
jgi:pentatricopeptide repeat protein